MAATITIEESNGIGETNTANVTNINFGSTDSPNLVPATYPIVAGAKSFEKWIKMAFLGGGYNKVDNLKVWLSAGVLDAEEDIKTNAGVIGNVQPTYSAPENNRTVPIVTVDIPETLPATSNVGINGAYDDATGLTPAGITKSDYLLLQLQTTSSLAAGNVSQKTFTFQYDEQ